MAYSLRYICRRYIWTIEDDANQIPTTDDYSDEAQVASYLSTTTTEGNHHRVGFDSQYGSGNFGHISAAAAVAAAGYRVLYDSASDAYHQKEEGAYEASSTKGVHYNEHKSAYSIAGDAVGYSYAVSSEPQDSNIHKALWVMLFWYFWVAEWFVAVGSLVTAGAVCNWYWVSRDRESFHCGGVVCASFFRTLRYHLGTAAMGSFVVAAFRFAKAVLEYIQAKLGDSENCVIKCACACCMCCLQCIQWMIEYINRNAYVITAMEGTGYCVSASRACELISANPFRVTAVGWVSWYVMWLGRLAICTGCVLVANCWISSDIHHVQPEMQAYRDIEGEKYSKDYTYDPTPAPTPMQEYYHGYVPPVTSVPKSFDTIHGDVPTERYLALVIVFVISYAVTYIVANTYNMVVDSILVCVLVDEDLNKEDCAMFAPKRLLSALDACNSGHAAQNKAFEEKDGSIKNPVSLDKEEEIDDDD